MSFKIIYPAEPTQGSAGIGHTATDLCSSEENDFIPVNCLLDGEVLTSRKNNHKSFMYSLNVPLRGRYSKRKYEDFCQVLKETNDRWYTMKHIGLGDDYYVGTGGAIVYLCPPHPPIPLMLMCVRSSKLFTLTKGDQDLSKFCLLVDSTFETDSKFSKMHRNIKRYINEVAENVDVLYTHNLNSICLKPIENPIPKVKTIIEVLQYAQSMNTELVQNIVDNV